MTTAIERLREFASGVSDVRPSRGSAAEVIAEHDAVAADRDLIDEARRCERQLREKAEADRDRLAARVAELEALCWADGPTAPKPEADADPCPVDAETLERWADLGLRRQGFGDGLAAIEMVETGRALAWLTRQVAAMREGRS